MEKKKSFIGRKFRHFIINLIYTPEIICNVNLMQKFKKVVYVCLGEKCFPPPKHQSSATFPVAMKCTGQRCSTSSVRARSSIGVGDDVSRIHICMTQPFEITIDKSTYKWRSTPALGRTVTSDRMAKDAVVELFWHRNTLLLVVSHFRDVELTI